MKKVYNLLYISKFVYSTHYVHILYILYRLLHTQIKLILPTFSDSHNTLVTNNRNFSDAKQISNAVEDMLNSQAPIHKKIYNKYGDEIQDDIEFSFYN